MQPSLLHDGANRIVTENTRLAGATSPQAENTAPQKCDSDFRSDVAYSVGVRLYAFFADLGCKFFHNARCLWPSTSRASKNPCVETSLSGFADSLFVPVSLDALVIFVCIFYGLRAAVRMRVESLHIEYSATKGGAPQTVCLDVQSSVIISGSGNTRENFSIERVIFWLYLDIEANVIHQVYKLIFDFVVS